MNALDAAHDVAESRPARQRLPLSLASAVGLAVLLVAAADHHAHAAMRPGSAERRASD